MKPHPLGFSIRGHGGDMGTWGHGTTGLGTEGTWGSYLDKIKEHGKRNRLERQSGISERAERCYNVASKACPRLPVKDVTMYQEKLASYSGKMLKHSIDSIVEVT